MRILADALVARSHPGLASMVTISPEPIVRVFDPFLPPAVITAEIAEFGPDLLVADPAWLIGSSLLVTLLRLSGCANTRLVVGSRHIDNVLKIQAAHGGFFDVVDLANDTRTVAEHLGDTHRGQSRLQSDRLWKTVAWPVAPCDIAAAPTDPADLAILELVRIGLTDAAIAESIHMSQQTVRNRVSAMLRRSGLTNRTQMAWAFTNEVLTMRMMESMNARR